MHTQPFLDAAAPETPEVDDDADLRTWDDFEVCQDEPGEVDCTGGVTSEQIAEAGIRWLRQLLEVNTVGEEWARFRTRIYAPKGAKTLHTATVVVHNDNAAHECPAPVALVDQTMDVERATNAGVRSGSGVRAGGSRRNPDGGISDWWLHCLGGFRVDPSISGIQGTRGGVAQT